MPSLNIFLLILGSIASLGIVSGGIGYLISRFKDGGRQIMSNSTEIITFYKTENESLKSIMAEKDKSNDEKFRDLTQQIGELRGQLTSEKLQNERLEKIFQNRDPDTLKFQEVVLQSVKDQSVVNQEIVRVLKEIHSMSTIEHERDFNITATVSKT